MQNLLCNFVWLNRSRIRLNRSKLGQNVFLQNSSNLAQARLTCRVLCFVLSIKGKTLATFGCPLCCVCESFVRSRGGCLHTYLGFSRFKTVKNLVIDSVVALKSLKKHKRVCLYLLENPRKREFVVSELARGRVSKFLLVGSNRMLAV